MTTDMMTTTMTPRMTMMTTGTTTRLRWRKTAKRTSMAHFCFGFNVGNHVDDVSTSSADNAEVDVDDVVVLFVSRQHDEHDDERRDDVEFLDEIW